MNTNNLVERCNQSIESFENEGVPYRTRDGLMVYRDTGASVLAVGHLDHVIWSPCRIQGNIARCPQLDDRLGIWIILDVLPRLGVNVDVLLTDGEETGNSTAQHFECENDRYNWIVEFDRRGKDVVFYDLESSKWRQAWNGLREVGQGSFSDISSLDHLGVCGANLGIGYHHEHSMSCYADLRETECAILDFAAFWESHKDTRFPIKKQKQKTFWHKNRYTSVGTSTWPPNEVAHDVNTVCPCCYHEMIGDTGLCLDCDYEEIAEYHPEVLATLAKVTLPVNGE